MSAWLPAITGTPSAIVVTSNHVYVSRLNSYNSADAGLMALNKTDGSMVWQTSTSSYSGFYGLAFDGSKLYISGDFLSIQGVVCN